MCRFLCLPRSQGFLNLMLPDGTPKDDVKVPEGQIGTDIEAAFESGKEVSVTIIAAMGEEQAITFKTTD
jgi:translation initiation factor 5A